MSIQPLSSTLTASEARANMYEMLEQSSKNLRRFTITHKGKPQAIVMSIEDLESIEETVDITLNKALMSQLKNAEQDRKDKRTTSLKEAKKIINR